MKMWKCESVCVCLTLVYDNDDDYCGDDGRVSCKVNAIMASSICSQSVGFSARSNNCYDTCWEFFLIRSMIIVLSNKT